jgi:hypothetical protein
VRKVQCDYLGENRRLLKSGIDGLVSGLLKERMVLGRILSLPVGLYLMMLVVVWCPWTMVQKARSMIVVGQAGKR